MFRPRSKKAQTLEECFHVRSLNQKKRRTRKPRLSLTANTITLHENPLSKKYKRAKRPNTAPLPKPSRRPFPQESPRTSKIKKRAPPAQLRIPCEVPHFESQAPLSTRALLPSSAPSSPFQNTTRKSDPGEYSKGRPPRVKYNQFQYQSPSKFKRKNKSMNRCASAPALRKLMKEVSSLRASKSRESMTSHKQAENLSLSVGAKIPARQLDNIQHEIPRKAFKKLAPSASFASNTERLLKLKKYYPRKKRKERQKRSKKFSGKKKVKEKRNKNEMGVFGRPHVSQADRASPFQKQNTIAEDSIAEDDKSWDILAALDSDERSVLSYLKKFPALRLGKKFKFLEQIHEMIQSNYDTESLIWKSWHFIQEYILQDRPSHVVLSFEVVNEILINYRQCSTSGRISMKLFDQAKREVWKNLSLEIPREDFARKFQVWDRKQPENPPHANSTG